MPSSSRSMIHPAIEIINSLLCSAEGGEIWQTYYVGAIFDDARASDVTVLLLRCRSSAVAKPFVSLSR